MTTAPGRPACGALYARRGRTGDTDRARPLLDAARRQFDEIGMTGWLRRADQLGERLR